VKAVHGGLECGISARKYPRDDMVSFRADARGRALADEKIYIDTVEKYWTSVAILRT